MHMMGEGEWSSYTESTLQLPLPHNSTKYIRIRP